MGVIDLRDAKFDASHTETLNGTWKMFFNQFIDPTQVADSENYIPFEVPNMWGGYVSKLGVLPDQGYASFYTKVLLPENHPLMGLQIPEMSTAYQIFIDGKLVSTIGTIGKEKASSIPKTKPMVLPLQSVTNSFEIVFHISNFHHKKSGLWDTIQIGSQEAVIKRERKNYFIAIFLSGSILIIGLYHIGLFFLQKDERSAIYFSLFALFTVLRITSTGEMVILDLFPTLSWEWRLKFDHISMYMALAFGIKFSNSLYPKEINRVAANIIFGLSFLFIIAAIITQGIINTYFVFYFQIIILISICYLLYSVVMAIKRKRQGALVYGLGYFIVCAATINDVLYSLNVIPSFYIMPLGVFLFFFSQAFILSVKSAKAFQTSKELSKELKEANQELEQKVKERTSIIEKKNEELQKSNVILQTREAELEEKASDLEKVNSELVEAQQQLQDTLNNEIQINQKLENTLKKLREAQDHLIQSEKMASLGQLTAGVAHEINNPINFISTGVEALQELLIDLIAALGKYENMSHQSYKSVDDLIHKLQDVRSELELDELTADVIRLIKDVRIGVDRTIEIVNGLRDFSRGNNDKSIIPADIHQCFASCLMILKAQYKHRIEVETDFDKNIPAVLCNIGQLHQVFLNILANAIQAIPDTGKIQISTLRLEENLIRIIIKDNGQGISEEHLKRIFDPFFTTKDVGKGTGLGLSITHGIISQHQGTIQFKSQLGQGTECIIHLPISQNLAELAQ